MAKNSSIGKGHRNGAVRERAELQPHGHWVKRDTETGRFVDQKKGDVPFKGVRREILFPTEPSTIGHRKIDRAVERVIARKK